MKFIVNGKNITVTEALKEKATQKVGKLEKFFKPDTEAHITLSVQKNRQIVEVTIPFHGMVLRAEESNEDMYASIDKVIDSLEKQILKNKNKLSKKGHSHMFKPEMFFNDSDLGQEEELEIVRSKKFAVKPMPVDEAVMQMNLLGHAFFMFRNSETNQVNVVYKRKSGDYGLIEPEF